MSKPESINPRVVVQVSNIFKNMVAKPARKKAKRSRIVKDFSQSEFYSISGWECPACHQKQDIIGTEYESFKVACECSHCHALQANPMMIPRHRHEIVISDGRSYLTIKSYSDDKISAAMVALKKFKVNYHPKFKIISTTSIKL